MHRQQVPSILKLTPSFTISIARLARHRLDAGTFGTMGVGLGFAIAAALYARDHAPGQRVVCVEGDSAFGFSGMELETIYRYNLPIVVIIINNNGECHECFWKVHCRMGLLGGGLFFVLDVHCLPSYMIGRIHF